MLLRLRENLLLKVISLVASVLLWVYVQVERPANSIRMISARVIPQNVPPGVDVSNLPAQISVACSGPVAILERLKDGDIQALVDLRTLRTDQTGTSPFRVQIVLPDYARALSYDQPPPLHVTANPRQQSQMAVAALYPKEPPAGFTYSRPAVHPRIATISGRADRLSRVERLVVIAAPPGPGTSIDGDFPVLVWDKDDNPVEGVSVEPDKVHVTVPLVKEPAAKIVTVSASIPDLPQPPYLLQALAIKPNQVKITGRPEKLNQIFTLSTDDIPLHDMTGNQTIEANLNIPADILVHDLEGKPLAKVTVNITIRKAGTPSSSGASAPAPGTDSAKP